MALEIQINLRIVFDNGPNGPTNFRLQTEEQYQQELQYQRQYELYYNKIQEDRQRQLREQYLYENPSIVTSEETVVDQHWKTHGF